MIVTPASPPRGVFRGTNFMTPEILYYVKGNLRGRIAYVEVAQGTGIERERIFGVTFRDANGGRFDPDPSHIAHSRAQVEKIIKEAV